MVYFSHNDGDPKPLVLSPAKSHGSAATQVNISDSAASQLSEPAINTNDEKTDGSEADQSTLQGPDQENIDPYSSEIGML